MSAAKTTTTKKTETEKLTAVVLVHHDEIAGTVVRLFRDPEQARMVFDENTTAAHKSIGTVEVE